MKEIILNDGYTCFTCSLVFRRSDFSGSPDTFRSNHYDPARDEYRFDDPIREDEEYY